ncbi:hypothetical protein [Vibrio vulnificus YJ016]|uniref:Uncharacterized protein n=1 Tax=Vibrio vulnificus (strain YJ016) TaxID=196600 RepID=Q7MGY9_VIBVY|nr:hypothetical protein [Vibrio vulnificus YJ016]
MVLLQPFLNPSIFVKSDLSLQALNVSALRLTEPFINDQINPSLRAKYHNLDD